MQEGAGVNLSVGLISGLSWIAGRATLCPMSTSPRFIHLRVHTEYSLLEGAIRLKKLPDLCVAADMPAIAVTDTNNLFAALEFSVSAAGAGLQPIIGCQLDLAYVDTAPGEKPRKPAPLVLLAQSEEQATMRQRPSPIEPLDGQVQSKPQPVKKYIYY